MLKDNYLQSNWPMLRISYLYYIENKTIREIKEITKLSQSTITRHLQRAKRTGVVQIQIPEALHRCIEISNTLKEQYNLRYVIVVPLRNYQISRGDIDERIWNVTLEGARYLQHIVTSQDVLGIGCDKTLCHLPSFLNPCWKFSTRFHIMNARPADISEADADTQVEQFAHILGRDYTCWNRDGFVRDDEELKKIMDSKEYKKISKGFDEITLSIAKAHIFSKQGAERLGLSEEEYLELKEKDACAEMLMHYFDRNGKEVKSSLSDKTLSIDIEQYKKIPTKLLLAGGDELINSLPILLQAGMADILIIDEFLGEEIIYDSATSG